MERLYKSSLSKAASPTFGIIGTSFSFGNLLVQKKWTCFVFEDAEKVVFGFSLFIYAYLSLCL